MWFWLNRILFSACLLSFVGCGYTLNHRLKSTFQGEGGTSKSIFVPVMDNRTSQTGAEIIFTNALIRELASHSEVTVGNGRKGSLVLQGTVLRVDIVPTANSDLGFKGLQPYRRIPSELGVRVSILFNLSDGDLNKPLWAKELTGFRRVGGLVNRTYDYQAPSAIGPITQSLVESIYPEIARLIMRDMYDEMVLLF